jgi:type IV pilus biogenesis protein CpaD/CtpE
MMDNLMNILKQREDLLLLRDFSQSYSVPNSVQFTNNTTALDNELQAVISRIGSYLRSSQEVIISLSGNGSIATQRISSIKDYLVEWGIDPERIETGSIQTSVKAGQISIKYLNADAINLLEMDLINNGKGGGR